MTRNVVNPPKQLVLPPSIQSNIELKKAFDDRDYILFQLWKRTGAGADLIDENISVEYEFDDISPFLSAFSPRKDDVVVTGIGYTTITNQIIVCTDAVIITLNAEPKDRETAKVLITNGDVQILGNGKLVMNDTDVQVITADVQGIVTLDFLYTVETDSWWIV